MIFTEVSLPRIRLPVAVWGAAGSKEIERGYGLDRSHFGVLRPLLLIQGGTWLSCIAAFWKHVFQDGEGLGMPGGISPSWALNLCARRSGVLTRTPVGFPRHLAGTWRAGAHLIPPCIVPSTTPTRHLLGLSVKTSLHTQPPPFLGAPRYVAWRGVAFFPHVQNAYRFPRR